MIDIFYNEFLIDQSFQAHNRCLTRAVLGKLATKLEKIADIIISCFMLTILTLTAQKMIEISCILRKSRYIMCISLTCSLLGCWGYTLTLHACAHCLPVQCHNIALL